MRDFIKDPIGSFRWMRILSFSLLMLLLYPLGIHAQDITLTGVVSDDTGEGLLGVSVLVKGTGNGTITNVEGKYSLKVKKQRCCCLFFCRHEDERVQSGWAHGH